MGDVNRKVEKCNGTFEILFYPRAGRDIISIVNVGGKKKKSRCTPKNETRSPKRVRSQMATRVIHGGR